MKSLLQFMLLCMLMLGLYSCAAREDNTNDAGRVSMQEYGFEKHGGKYYITFEEDAQEYVENSDKIIEYEATDTERRILICADETIASIKVVSVDYKYATEEPEHFVDVETEYEYENLYPQESLIIDIVLPEGIPTKRIILTDTQGVEFSFFLSESGKDGSLLINPYEE